MSKDAVSVYEVDLRWGILQEDTENQRAVRLCLEEIDACHPLFICLLGERYGWRPSSNELAGLAGLASADLPAGASSPPSVVEIEIRYALSRASAPDHPGPRPVFLLRSRQLSERLGSAWDDPGAMDALKRLVRKRGGEFVIEYDDFEAFEAQAERFLERALADWKQSEAAYPQGRSVQELDRPALLAALTRACEKSRPGVLTGPPSSGLSTLGKRWLAAAGDRGVLIDARAVSQKSLAPALAEARLPLDSGGVYSSQAHATIDEEIVKLRDVENVSSIVVTHQLRDAFFVATHEAVRDGGAIEITPADPQKCDEAEFIMLKDGVITFEGNAAELRSSTDPYIQTFLS